MERIIIADNQDITKAGLLFLLKEQQASAVIQEISNKGSLIGELIRDRDIIVILDYTLFDFNNVDELLILEERFPKTQWILFSDSLSDAFLERVLLNSSRFGIILKDNSKEEISLALVKATQGERYICNDASNQLLNKPKPTAKTDYILTITEREILKEISLGKTTKEIATERYLSFHTVNTHRKNIFRKLGVNTVHEATRYAMKAGIIDLTEYYI